MVVREGIRKLKTTFGNVFRVEPLLLLFSLAMAVWTFGEGVYVQFFNLFLRDFGIPLEQIGLFFFALYGATATVSILAGYISDRIGRNIMVISLLVMGVVVFSYTLVQNPAQLLFLRIVQGVAAGFIYPVIRAFLMDKTNERNRGQTFGTFTLFSSIASMGAAIVAGALMDKTERFALLFYIAAAFTVAAALFLLATVRDMGTGFTVTKMGLPTRDLVHNKTFLAVLLMFGTLYFANGMLTPILSIFAREVIGMSFTVLGVFFSVMGAVYAVSQFVAGSLSDVYGRKKLLVYPLLMYAVGVFVAGLSLNVTMFFAAYVLTVTGASPYATVAFGLVGDTTPVEQRGIANGAIVFINNIGMMAGLLVGPAIAGFTTMRIPFFVCSLFVLATIVQLSLLLPGDSHKKETGTN